MLWLMWATTPNEPNLRIHRPNDDFEAHFFGSVVFHALLVWALFYWVGRPPVLVDPPITVEVKESNSQQRSESARHGKASGRGDRAFETPPRVSLADLGMSMNDLTRPREVEDSGEVRSGAETFDPTGGWDLMNPDPKIMRFNLYVYNTVQRQLDLESMRNQIRLTGTVKVKIWFDADGNYLAAETVYQAIDPDFQAIVDRALRAAFAQPVPRPYLYKREKFFIEREVFVRQGV